MPEITFTVTGTPVPKGRPRIRQSRKHAPKVPTSNPISLRTLFIMPITKSLSKKKREEINCSNHTKRPDLDNLVKLVKDSMNNLFWVDDSQVYGLGAVKAYGVVPRTVVTMQW